MGELRWWERLWPFRECRGIASMETAWPDGVKIVLCRRWAWHRGQCRG